VNTTKRFHAILALLKVSLLVLVVKVVLLITRELLTVYGLVRLVYKPLVLICTADLLGEKNIVPWLISRLIMAAEQSRSTHPPGGFMGLFNNQPHFSLNDSANLI